MGILHNYGRTLDPEKTAKASGRELRVSHKPHVKCANAVRGMMLSTAKAYLRDVIAKKKAVPFTRYKKKLVTVVG
jgi:large subunit ribosomal protein L22